jgi:hypothetical protein
MFQKREEEKHKCETRMDKVIEFIKKTPPPSLLSQ